MAEDKAMETIDWLDYVRVQPCSLCGATPPSEPHHLSHIEGTGMGMKPRDWFIVPVCRLCHQRAHTKLNKELKEWLTAINLRLLGQWLDRRIND